MRIVAGLCVLLAIQPSAAFSQLPTAEMKSSWLEYRSAIKSLSGEKKVLAKIEDKEQEFKSSSVLKLKGKSMLHLQRPYDDEKGSLVTGVNDRYAFVLFKKPNTNDWAQKELVLGGGDNLQKIGNESVPDYFFKSSSPHFFVYWKNLDWLFSQESLKILSISQRVIDGRNCTCVKFNNHHADDSKEFYPIQSGELCFDSACMWCLKEYNIDAKWSAGKVIGRIVAKFDYAIVDGNLPVIRSVDESMVTNSKASNIHSLYTFDFTANQSLSDSEFTLSAFGLPEPVTQTPPPPNRNFLWITLASVAAVIVAVLVRRKVKSLEAKTP